jgi:hypothetical protein
MNEIGFELRNYALINTMLIIIIVIIILKKKLKRIRLKDVNLII